MVGKVALIWPTPWNTVPFEKLAVVRLAETFREEFCLLWLKLPLAFTLVSCTAYSSTLMMEANCTSEMPVDFQRTNRGYIQRDRNLYSHRYENLNCCTNFYVFLTPTMRITFHNSWFHHSHNFRWPKQNYETFHYAFSSLLPLSLLYLLRIFYSALCSHIHSFCVLLSSWRGNIHPIRACLCWTACISGVVWDFKRIVLFMQRVILHRTDAKGIAHYGLARL
jgi:hypothetical protein